MKYVCSLLLSVCIGLNAWAEAPIAAIQAVLVKPAKLCGHFEQVKQLVDIKKPLVSSGHFCVESGKEIVWATEKPFTNTLTLTPDSIRQSHGTVVTSDLNAKQEPVVKMINNVLFSLLAGDLTQLQQLFIFNGAILGKQWYITLDGRDPHLAQALGQIKLQGSRFVKQVVMRASNGDKTTIVFSQLKTAHA